MRIPSNVLVTDWLPALQVNKMADLAVIHGGVGTVMTAALAGKPVVDGSISLAWRGSASRCACPSRGTRPQRCRRRSSGCTTAMRPKEKATAFATRIAEWDGPRLAAQELVEQLAARR